MSRSGRKRGEPDGRAASVSVSVHPDVVVDPEGLRRAAAKAAGLRDADVRGVHVLRRTVDARRGRVRVNLELALDLPGMPYRAALVGSMPVAAPLMERRRSASLSAARMGGRC